MVTVSKFSKENLAVQYKISRASLYRAVKGTIALLEDPNQITIVEDTERVENE